MQIGFRYQRGVPVDLTEFERGAPHDGDIAEAFAALQHRLGRAQLAQIVHQKRLIVVIEGPEGAGKRAFVQVIGAVLDPTHFTVTSVLADRRRARDGHWLARFWAGLPEAGHIAIFYHSWYRRVIEDRLLRLVTDKECERAFDEINEFESQQRDYGTMIVKLFFHVTDTTQARRVADRQDDQWMRHLVGPEELRTSQARAAYRDALRQVMAQSDSRWAPWTLIDANDSEAAQIAGLTAIAEALERGVPQSPPDRPGSAIPVLVHGELAQPVG